MNSVKELLAKAEKTRNSHRAILLIGPYKEALALLDKKCEWKWNKQLGCYRTQCNHFPCRHLVADMNVTVRTCPFCGKPIEEVK
jgi:hypothetical protein